MAKDTTLSGEIVVGNGNIVHIFPSKCARNVFCAFSPRTHTVPSVGVKDGVHVPEAVGVSVGVNVPEGVSVGV